jgi:hypothetical protein
MESSLHIYNAKGGENVIMSFTPLLFMNQINGEASKLLSPLQAVEFPGFYPSRHHPAEPAGPTIHRGNVLRRNLANGIKAVKLK